MINNFSSEKPIVQLDNWSLTSNQDGWKPPELVRYFLAGVVTGHPYLEDGERIRTSFVVGRQGDLIETVNTLYRLGTVDPDYEALYPNAKEQILARLSEAPS